jgi:hypothetical protein
MYKMLKLGVTGKLWCIIDDFHSKSESAVVVNQCKSKYFSVTEGGHQGGVLSPGRKLSYCQEKQQILYFLTLYCDI